jgi:hypothetical protein
VTVTADPLIASPVALPLPSVDWTLLAVTAPSNSETELSDTAPDLQVDPLTPADSKVRTERYADGPRLDAGVPNAITRCDGSTRAAAPAPTQAAGSEEDASGANDGAAVVAVVVVLVVAVVVVLVVVAVPSARADATATAAPTRARSTSHATRRITKV